MGNLFSKEDLLQFLNNNGDVIIDALKWVVPTLAATGISLSAINAYADHNAMMHGYERQFRIGPFETSVKRLPD